MVVEFSETILGDITDDSREYVHIDVSGKSAGLDGEFTLEHLEQIVAKMKELQG